jgi:3-dehydroquinate dehydratase-1
VMGDRFRYARAILPLFGSELVYCSVGTPTAEGQYSVEEFTQLIQLLKKGH